MPEDVDDLTRRDPLAPLLDPWRIGRRRRWSSGEDEPEDDTAGGMRCGWGRYDRKTREGREECGARAMWRLDLICDLCGPRVGYACDLHKTQVPDVIKRGWLHCHANGPDGHLCKGDLVEVVHAEYLFDRRSVAGE